MTFPTWHEADPPNYVEVYRWRQQRLIAMRASKSVRDAALAYYANHPAEFITHWCDTFDPRSAFDQNLLAYPPLVLFPRQVDLVEFLVALLEGRGNGLVEKSRDMGATWVACCLSVWLWRFKPGAAIGWGSRIASMVDKLGDPGSIFEKMRIAIRRLPREFWPVGFKPGEHMAEKRILNPENGSSIIGETGDNIGRGGRTLIYFKDEAAHYDRPELIEAALGNNTDVQVDISSVNGIGNVFHRKRESGVVWERGKPIVRTRSNVFIMDWRENPLHTQQWYDDRREEKESQGLLHVFEQEVDRSYGAAVTGTIIPAQFARACLDAHRVIPGMDVGKWRAAIDPADEGGDKHAAGAARNVVLRRADHWGEGDTGMTTRRCVSWFRDLGTLDVMYDSVGVGAGVKTEANRLAALPAADTERMPRGMRFIAWNAGAGVLWPDDGIDPTDPNSATNKEQYANLKAQAWWALRTRCEKTMKAVAAVKAGLPCPYHPDELFSIDSDAIGMAVALQLVKEMSQAVRKTNTVSTKITVDKKPPGTMSPNLADMVVMMMFPVPSEGYDLAAAL